MAYGLTERLKKKVITTKQDVDQKILKVANDSIKSLKTQVKNYTSLDLDKMDINGQLARDVAVRVLEKAQDIRKNLTTQELIKASKKTGRRVIDSAKDSLVKKSNSAKSEKQKKVLKKVAKSKTEAKVKSPSKKKTKAKTKTKS